jgi:hypothetical protein
LVPIALASSNLENVKSVSCLGISIKLASLGWFLDQGP